MGHLNFRVWMYDLKKMAMVTDIDFRTRVVTYEDVTTGDHPASTLMESTLLRVYNNQELWESDLVLVPGLLSSTTYAIEWYFNRWVLRDPKKKTMKEITQSGLKNYKIVGNIYG